MKPDIVIIDSIQTFARIILNHQRKYFKLENALAELIKYAKESNVPVLLIGHITKDGTIADPRFWKHGRYRFTI